ncbi:hypothetical protein [Pontibacter roseus]|uniref:hypothetical protein n=1 Tax=Pontibacter roseus TaxID=336989 RepID=UPI0012F8DFFE|nr:hypothetical protein [Pontibacter roseus]
MKTIYKKIALFLLFTPLLSCGDGDEVNPEANTLDLQKSSISSNTKGIIEKNYYYKGKFSILKSKIKNGVPEFVEGTATKDIEAAFNIPTLVTYVDISDTSTVYLFDSYTEYDKTINKRNLKMNSDGSLSYTSVSNMYTTPPAPTPPLIAYRHAMVFANSNYDLNGPYLKFYYVQHPTYLNNIEYPELISINNTNFNDAISSLHVDNKCDECADGTNYIRIQLYEHSYYGGKQFILTGYPGWSGGNTNLADYKISTFSSWRDKASSMKVTHGY